MNHRSRLMCERPCSDTCFEHYNYGDYVKVFCIGGERPQPESFINRFAGNAVPVVWASERDGPEVHGVRHKKTGRTRMIMSIIILTWTSENEAQVRVEAFSDGLAANWNMLDVVYKKGRWTVKSDHLIGQS